VRKEVCSDFLSRYEADGESFLSRIVTGDETCIHHFEPETKTVNGMASSNFSSEEEV
jgi:hypothetical protein